MEVCQFDCSIVWAMLDSEFMVWFWRSVGEIFEEFYAGFWDQSEDQSEV